jgi:2,3-bisphosphoglycerate-independent phosphoglycerate mutase
MNKKKVALIILDGLALGNFTNKNNAVAQANIPWLKNTWEKTNKVSMLKTDENSVGLPAGQVGGSEVGHMTIGAGRPIKHLLTKINEANFAENAKIMDAMQRAKKRGKIHLMGMISDGGIHSYDRHCHDLQMLAGELGIAEIFIHAFLDGRDVGERTAESFLNKVSNFPGKIATISGRFFAMDRDNNWDRTEKSYKVLTGNFTEKTEWKNILQEYYKQEITSDYYLPPTRLIEEGQIENDDIVIFFNYRSDRASQLSDLLTGKSETKGAVKISQENLIIFGPYCSGAVEPFNFGEKLPSNTLGEILSKNNLSQLRISETEKYPHVTFFLNGQYKEPFPNEERILIPSPKCSSYAEKPEMSALEQTTELITRLENSQENPAVIIQNYANADLVGHSGKLLATIEAVEVIEKCLKKSLPILQTQGYHIIITADHGNADEMQLSNGQPNASHTHNLVPLILFNPQGQQLNLKNNGTLADIAPTILQILGIEIPTEMTGKNLQE